MSTAAVAIRRTNASRSAAPFAIAVLSVALAACALAGWFPLGVSLVTVFLFAGPHNWMEGRYMLARMPARWGPLRPFFLTGIGGVLVLTAAFAALPALGRWLAWSDEGFDHALAIWNTLLVLWILILAHLRSRQNPRRDWSWLWPAGFVVIAAAWLWPRGWDLGLVYLHPLLALVFLDREIGRQRRAWQRAYRACLLALPALLALLWWRLADTPSLPGRDALSARITDHAGSGVLHDISSHLLVSTHVFLETLHYGVWLVMIPLVSFASAPWEFAHVPLARRSRTWRMAIVGTLAVGLLVVVGFWAGFLADYPLTRDVYFTVAMLHVLAEAPFLLRLI